MFFDLFTFDFLFFFCCIFLQNLKYIVLEFARSRRVWFSSQNGEKNRLYSIKFAMFWKCQSSQDKLKICLSNFEFTYKSLILMSSIVFLRWGNDFPINHSSPLSFNVTNVNNVSCQHSTTLFTFWSMTASINVSEHVVSFLGMFIFSHAMTFGFLCVWREKSDELARSEGKNKQKVNELYRILYTLLSTNTDTLFIKPTV